MKWRSILFIFLSLELSFCGQSVKKSPATISSSDSGTRKSAGFGWSGSWDDFLATFGNAGFWFNGASGMPEIPVCGEPPPPNCRGLIAEDDVPYCERINKEIMKRNVENGFYFEEISKKEYCNEECKPEKDFRGSFLRKSLNVLRYGTQQIMRGLYLCQMSCQQAVSQGLRFAVKCRNLNDDPERRALAEEVQRRLQELEHNPELQAKYRELTQLKAQTELARERVIAMEKAENTIGSYWDSVFFPKLKQLADEFGQHQDDLHARLQKDAQRLARVRDAALYAQKELLERTMTESEISKSLTSFKSLEVESCQPLPYASLHKKTLRLEEKREDLFADLTRQVKRLENPKLIEWVQDEEIPKMRAQLALQPIPQGFLDESIAGGVCSIYRQTLLAHQLAFERLHITGYQQKLAQLIQEIENIEKDSVRRDNASQFKLSLRKQVRRLRDTIGIAFTGYRWNQGQYAVSVALKTLHLVIFPAIELNTELTQREKKEIWKDVSELILKPVELWNQAAASGIKTMVQKRVGSLQWRLKVILSLIEKKSADEQQVLRADLKRLFQEAHAPVVTADTSPWSLASPPETEAELVGWDTRLDGADEVIQTFLALLQPNKGATP